MLQIIQFIHRKLNIAHNKPEVTFVDDQILEAYLVVAETVVAGISYPKQILLWCDVMSGKKGNACWTLKKRSQPGLKVKLQTACPGLWLQ